MRPMRAYRFLLATLIPALLVGCGTSPTPAHSGPAATRLVTSPSQPSPSMASPSPGSSLEPSGKIVFYRNDGTWPFPAFMIDPDGSNETRLHDGGLMPGVWSRDGSRLVVATGLRDGEWIRPALVNADGSGFRVLDAYPDRKMLLDPIGWSSDESRIFVFSGRDDVDPADVGLYTVRASDGGDLRSVLPSKPGKLDYVHVSTDGTKLLVNRLFDGADGNLDGTQFVVNVDGSGQRQLNPPGTVPADLGDFWSDFDGRPRISEAWSPDETLIAFTAFVKSAGSSALYLVKPDGSDLHQIVPTTVGAASAQWSPDGTLIAFTSRLRTQPQVWVVRPDGSEPKQLTDGADGSTSIMPVWSPDGAELLFQRKTAGHVTLWTMNADGTDQKQLSPTPVASDYMGGYAWWPAPSN